MLLLKLKALPNNSGIPTKQQTAQIPDRYPLRKLIGDHFFRWKVLRLACRRIFKREVYSTTPHSTFHTPHSKLFEGFSGCAGTGKGRIIPETDDDRTNGIAECDNHHYDTVHRQQNIALREDGTGKNGR